MDIPIQVTLKELFNMIKDEKEIIETLKKGMNTCTCKYQYYNGVKINRETDDEIIEHFKKYQFDLYSLEIIFKDLLKQQRYALAKLYKNQIENLQYLKSKINE